MSNRDKSLDGHLLCIMSPAEKQERASEAMRKHIAELEARIARVTVLANANPDEWAKYLKGTKAVIVDAVLTTIKQALEDKP